MKADVVKKNCNKYGVFFNRSFNMRKDNALK